MQQWTDEDERRLWPYVLHRCHPRYLAEVARTWGGIAPRCAGIGGRCATG